MKLFKVNIRYKSKSIHDFSCHSGCRDYFSSKVLLQLLNSVKKTRGISFTRAKSPLTQVYFQELVNSHFKDKMNYMFVLNADPYVYHGFNKDSVKKKYKFYKYIIKKCLRGKPYKKAHYQIFPEFGDKNAKFHVNLLINLEYYPYVKLLCHDLRRELTTDRTRYPKYSCTLPRTYGRKPNTYACKDAVIMYKMGIVPFSC